MDSPAIQRCIDEQKRGAEYLEQNGHYAPESALARLGISDWLLEEAMLRDREAARLERYQKFLLEKCNVSKSVGFDITEDDIRPLLQFDDDVSPVAWKPHQKVAIRWGVRGGRRALFEAFGLGKSLQQIEMLRIIIERIGGIALIVAPLGVRAEFIRDAKRLDVEIKFIRSIGECSETGIYITNYETVRDGKLDPAHFTVTTLDEASILRGFGGTKTFREFMRLFEAVPYRFVATATPDPNEYIELLAYAAYLGIMEVGEAKTRFFKRDATKADVLTLREHCEEDFWLWVASWALFLEKPSDLGFDDSGYDLRPMQIFHHEVASTSERVISDRDGQYRLIPNASLGVIDAAREKRDSLSLRVAAAKAIVEANPNDHFVLWHDLDAEWHAIEKAIPGVVSVAGTMDLEDREESIAAFSAGKIRLLSTKPQLSGSGCNFQRFCHKVIYVGIGFKFNDWYQSLHRVQRFLQEHDVEVHLIYCDTERSVRDILFEKWERHKEKVAKMQAIIKEYGLSELALAQALTRSIGCERIETKGDHYTLVNNDSIVEMGRIADNSVGLVLTSIPFSTQYEYTPSYNDFGHTEDNEHFFRQMDFLTPELYRAMMPGRFACIHVKDRIVPGGMTGFGFQEAYPFHADVIYHFLKHGFRYLGMKTITTDVVRENNQTYRLGWTEQCKDATKMGFGMPEYLLLFRKPQTATDKGYADVRVVKDKKRYSKARWQVDAHAFTRSNGNRHLLPEEIATLPHQKIFGMFHDFYLEHVYDFEHHVKLGEALEAKGRLPVTFMLLQPPSVHSDVWTDITRMLTVNALQAQKGRVKHICPMQFDIADRVITQMSNEGDLVLDPFSGLGTVPARAVALRRRGLGIELNHGYFSDAALYCKAAEEKVSTPTLFDLIAAEESAVEA